MKTLNHFLATAFVVVVASTAFASSDVWNGGGADNNWSTAGNWGGTAPAAGDFLFFGSGTFAPNNNFAADTLFGNLSFTNVSSGFTLTGNEIVLTNAVDLGGGTVGYGSISNVTANAESVNLPVVLAPGKHNITSSGGGVLTLGGTITRNTDATVLFNPTTPNTINVTGSGLANDATGILGGWATYGPADYAALDGSGNVIAYTGYSLQTANFTAVAGANVKLSQNNATTTITPQDDGGTVADMNSLLYAPSANNNETVTVGAGHILRLGAVGGVFTTNTAKTLLVGSGGTEFLTAGGVDNTPGVLFVGSSSAGTTPQTVVVRLQSVITNNGSGAVSVVSSMAQDCEFGLFGAGSKLNTYSGGTYLLGGRNTENVTNAFGTGPVYVFPGAQILCQISPFTNSLFISGFGTTEGGGNGAIRANAQTLTGPITLMGTAAIGSKANANSTFSGVISGPGGLILGSGSTVGAGTATFTVGSANGPNTYAGDTTIGYAPSITINTLTMAVANIMPNGPGAGNLILNARSATALSIFDLNGFSQTINGLISTTNSPAANIVTNSATSTPATLTLGANNATATFGGVIADHSGASLSITKTGSGAQTLSGTNTYTGNTTISAGALLVSGSLASGSAVSLGAGALAGTGAVNGAVTTASSNAQINQESNYLATSAVGTLTLGSLNMSSGGACYLDLGTSHLSGNDEVVVNGALTLGSGTVFHINALSGAANMDVADYVLIQAASIAGGTVSSTPVWDGATPANAASYVVEISGNNVVLHNSTYTGPVITSAAATPSSVSYIQSALLSVTVTNGTPPYTVKVNASSIGGSSTLSLVRNTSTAPGVYIYTNSVTPSGSTANGNYLLTVSATDNTLQTYTANISLTVIGASLVWNGDVSGNSFWDTSSPEWQGGLIYRDGDFPRFDDTATGVNAANVNLQTTLSPGGIVVSNTTANYTFNNNNIITGGARLLKQGSGTLTMLEGSDNFSGGIVVGGGSLIVGNFYGTIAISGGLVVTNGGSALLDPNAGTISGNVTIGAGSSVQIGNNDQYGSLPPPSGSITMDGTLIFDNSTAVPTVNVSNVISGASTGNLVQSNANTVVLFAPNTFAGNIAVYGGTLSNTVTAANNGSTGGFGASTNAGRTIKIAAGATLSSSKNNWFGNQGVADANFPSLIIDGGTAFGSRYTAVGNITLDNGATLIVTHTNLSLESAGYFDVQFRGSVTVGGSSPSVITNGDNGGDHLSTNTVFNVAVTSGSGPDLTVYCPLLDQSADYSRSPGGFTKSGAGTMLLTGGAVTNSFTGNTVVGAGTLALSGASNPLTNSATIVIAGGATLDVSSLAPGFVLRANQTLSNNASTAVLNGNFNVSTGTNSLTYASETPSFTIKNGTLTLASTTVFKVNNVGAALAINSYKIVSKGTGGSVAGTVPSVTVSGVTASLQITSGELYLVVTAITPPTPHITGIHLNGATLTISATNGADSGPFVLLESTNVALPLSQWTPVLTNTFDSSGDLNLSTNIINPSNGQQFYILSQ